MGLFGYAKLPAEKEPASFFEAQNLFLRTLNAMEMRLSHTSVNLCTSTKQQLYFVRDLSKSYLETTSYYYVLCLLYIMS